MNGASWLFALTPEEAYVQRDPEAFLLKTRALLLVCPL